LQIRQGDKKTVPLGNGFRFEVQNQEFDPQKDVKSLLVSRLFFVLINKGTAAIMFSNRKGILHFMAN